MADLVDSVPMAMILRREDVRNHLNKLIRFLARDIPDSERAIALRRYDALREEAQGLGIEP